MKHKKTLTVFICTMFLILVCFITCDTVNAQNIEEEIRTIESNLIPPILVKNEPEK